MVYTMEELIPIVAKLVEKYTGNESSSITYEKAQQLMGAVIYCIRKIPGNGRRLQKVGDKLPAEAAYKIGYENLIKKVKDTLNLYNDILSYFDDYNNRCLSDTVIKGMPEFFKWYDAKFYPQDTILTLDYPVLIDMTKYQGIDAIYAYLKCIEREQLYLRQFQRSEIVSMLAAYDPAYKDMIDNLYWAVTGHSVYNGI